MSDVEKVENEERDSEEAWQYARLIARGSLNHITRVKHEHRDLMADIMTTIHERSIFPFCFIEVNEGIGQTLRAFALQDHPFRDPLGNDCNDWKADLTGAANFPDTPQGWLDALKHITREYPHTVVLLIDVAYSNEEFYSLFENCTMDARLVIIE